MTKIFAILGIVLFYILTAIFLTYAEISYTGMTGVDVETGSTPYISQEDIPTTSIGGFFVSGITISGVFSTLLGIFSFQLQSIPFWVNLILYLPLLAMLVLIYELIRGV